MPHLSQEGAQRYFEEFFKIHLHLRQEIAMDGFSLHMAWGPLQLWVKHMLPSFDMVRLPTNESITDYLRCTAEQAFIGFCKAVAEWDANGRVQKAQGDDLKRLPQGTQETVVDGVIEE